MISFTVLAQATVDSVFGGTIAPPPGAGWGANPIEGIGTLIIFGIQIFLMLGGIVALFFMLWGAFDWINSGGDPDAIAKARTKITNAVIGLILTVAALGIFVLVATDVLKIMRIGPNGEWQFGIPTINKCVEAGGPCAMGANKCCDGLTCSASNVCE